MYSPALLERVCVYGRDGLFLVIRAEYDEQAADLLPFTFGQIAMRDVPFEMLERWELDSVLVNLRPLV